MRIERENLMAVIENTREFSRANQPFARCASFCSRRHLEPELANTPDVRAEEVARGKALVADPNYPSKEQLRKVASVLAANSKRDLFVAPAVAALR